MAEKSVQDAIEDAERVLAEPWDTPRHSRRGEDALKALVEAVQSPDIEWMVCVGGACERPEDDDLPLAEALDRARELALEQERYVEEGYSAEPVQAIAYTKRALESMAKRREAAERGAAS